MQTGLIRHRFTLLIWLLAFSVTIPACKKNTDVGPSDPGGEKSRTVYVAGSEAIGGGQFRATFWKRGEVNDVVHLTNGEKSAEARGIFVFGDDVYTTGAIIGDGATQIVYWKNTEGFTVTDGTRTAYPLDLFVEGSTPYIAGYESNGSRYVAKYWKGLEAHDLTDGKYHAYALSVFVVNGTVYTCGTERNEDGIDVAKYWKNSTATTLTDGENNASANSIFVSGNDVYVAGHEKQGSMSIAKYWKNGVPVELGDGVTTSDLNCIRVSGSDVYVTGHVGSSGALWKNGTRITHALGSSTPSMALVGNDVYTAGFNFHVNSATALVTKNGVPIDISVTGDKSAAWDIFVAEE